MLKVIFNEMKKLWKYYKIFAITVFSVLLLDLAVVLFFGFYRPQIKNADAIVVLGAAINTPALYNRSIQALHLYQAGNSPLVVASGGRISNKDISEAGYIQKVINSNSVTKVPIILEESSRDTYENIKNTKAKLGVGKSLIIVSDQYHLARAVIMAKREGFGPVYWSSPKPSYYKKTELAYYYMREVMAMIAYIPRFIFG